MATRIHQGLRRRRNAVLVSCHLLSEVAQMADSIVVIGKEKLIASTTMDELVAGNTGGHIVVRAANTKPPEKVFKQKKILFTARDGALVITGQAKETIGEIAFAAGVALHELSSEKTSLEEAFLALTGGAEEYKAH